MENMDVQYGEFRWTSVQELLVKGCWAIAVESAENPSPCGHLTVTADSPNGLDSGFIPGFVNAQHRKLGVPGVVRMRLLQAQSCVLWECKAHSRIPPHPGDAKDPTCIPDREQGPGVIQESPGLCEQQMV